MTLDPTRPRFGGGGGGGRGAARQTAARRLVNARRELKLEKNAWKEDPRTTRAGGGDFNNSTQVRRAQAKVNKLEAQMKTPAKGKSKGMPATPKGKGKAIAKKSAKNEAKQQKLDAKSPVTKPIPLLGGRQFSKRALKRNAQKVDKLKRAGLKAKAKRDAAPRQMTPIDEFDF
jgi:hypothetical protein